MLSLTARTSVIFLSLSICAKTEAGRPRNAYAEAEPAKIQTQRSADNARAYAITQRLRVGLQGGKVVRPRLKSQSERNLPIDVFTVNTVDGGNRFSADGLPLARVASVEIQGDIKDVAAMWTDAPRRRLWDKTASHCTTIIAPDSGANYSYFRGHAGWLVPAREFVYSSVTLPPAVVGISSLSAVVIFNQDVSAKLAANAPWNVVRGEQNSLLVLEPLGLTKTRATLLVECDPKGWAWLLGSYVDVVAGDSTVQALLWLKRGVEDENEDDAGLSIEEVAQRRFKRKQARENAFTSSIVDEASSAASSSREDMQATVQLLTSRLEKLSQDEKSSGLDLSSLKARVHEDLAKAKAILKKG